MMKNLIKRMRRFFKNLGYLRHTQVQILKPYTLWDSGFMQARCCKLDNNFIGLPMNSGKIGIHYLKDKEYFHDFGGRCVQGRVEFIGQYCTPEGEPILPY